MKLRKRSTDADVVDVARNARPGRTTQDAADRHGIPSHKGIRSESQRAPDSGDVPRHLAVDIRRAADGNHIALDYLVPPDGNAAADVDTIALVPLSSYGRYRFRRARVRPGVPLCIGRG